MKKAPLISIVLPIYNIENYLRVCMDSILNQTYSNLEIIMVDDGSTDKCSMICDEYMKMDKRIIVYHKKNGGLSDARNYGISRARGEYIACIDPDDYVDRDYIEYLFSLIEKYGTKMSLCQSIVHYDSGKTLNRGLEQNDECMGSEECLKKMLYHDVIDTSAWGKLYSKSLFKNVSYPKGRIFEDIGTTYALMLQCSEIAVGYESKYHYIFHDNSIVNSSFNSNKFDLLIMTDKMAKDVKKKFPHLNKATLRRQVYARFSTLNQMLNITNFAKEKKEIIHYIKKNSWEVIRDPLTPKRDKIAIALLFISYNLYRFTYIQYKKTLINERS